MVDTPPILIVGAGPTGLVLALSLARRGAAFRIIDQHDGPGEASRALAMHARTLEFYAQFGFADAVVAAGNRIETLHFRRLGRELATIRFSNIGAGLSPFPFVLDFPQDEHERFLVDRLRELGVEIEWQTTLKSFVHDADGVTATIDHGGREEQARFSYVCGCDGVHSRVREMLAVGFPGGTYENLYYVADVKLAEGQSGDLHAALGPDNFALRMPARKGAMERLIGIAPEHADGSPVTFEDVRPTAEPLLGVRVASLNWFSTYRVHHRVASHFRVGRCFLLGDAGHVHSPAGGQGMNTGVGDAVNLGWKLAHVLHGRAAPELLDSYEAERMPFARQLVATTDRAFKAVVSRGLTGKLIRSVAMPRLMPLMSRFAAGRRMFFRLVSQIEIHYPDSPISGGKAGKVAGGDRLPWVADSHNFDPLRSLDWQLHVYGEPRPDLTAAAGELGLPLHAFGWSGAAEKAGLALDAAYLIRPDGYVALAGCDADGLRTFVERHALRFTGE
ncbi:FAD-dependent monooxygenase [Sphingomonas tabacisoli]|uniref:FAD-dependent monooxygenase n=1 Tax=Sphingomonas tabacisoli TaxID=2249466 RepID=A0ABW4I1D0_9SPHN